ncbi:MAG TPA: multiubiquitin domain-containing protein [Urbifossiella sp.]|jgi:hypothetical protein|nr:multiubiquitin domain-containing protein [Urbifossiella sp.]
MADKHEVRVHIDREAYKSPNPTDGEALYRLGRVQAGFVLYQEVQGDAEDGPVPNTKDEVRLSEDEHFYSAPSHRKVFTIVLNGREKEVDHKIVSFAEIVAMAAIPGDANTVYTVTYKRGRRDAQGTMVEGDTVKIKNGMIFNVKATSKS